MSWAEKWPGGRVWVDGDGRKSYVIRKSVNGKRFEVSTRCSSLRAAIKALEEFEQDPERFRPGGVHDDRLTLDDKLIERHIEAAKDEGVSVDWVRKKRAYLKSWATKLKGRDLRTITLKDIQAALEGEKAKTHRKAVIKHLYSYLREQGLLTRNEDPTLDFVLGTSTTGKPKKKRSVSREDFTATLAKMPDEYRDILLVQGGSGMHVTEVYRLASGHGEVGATFIGIQHKRGTVHRQAVEAQVIEAAQRVQERGGFSISRYAKAVRKAAKDAGVKPWSPGGMRHTVTVWMLQDGATLAEVSTWLGHLSPATTKKFYSEWATIPMPSTRKLRVVAKAG